MKFAAPSMARRPSTILKLAKRPTVAVGVAYNNPAGTRVYHRALPGGFGCRLSLPPADEARDGFVSTLRAIHGAGQGCLSTASRI